MSTKHHALEAAIIIAAVVSMSYLGHITAERSKRPPEVPFSLSGITVENNFTGATGEFVKLPGMYPTCKAPQGEEAWKILYASRDAEIAEEALERKLLLVSTAMETGMPLKLASHVVKRCHEGGRDSLHCVRLATSIAKAEKGGCSGASTNCWGVMDRRPKPTKEIAFDQWLGYYDRKWKGLTPQDIYGKWNSSHYCTSEVSSNTRGWCPNGLKHATAVWNRFSNF